MRKNKGNGEAYRWLIGQAKAWVSDECLIWPFNKPNGYGMFGLNGELLYAHRYMCELVHGAAPSPDHEASHSCGNGHVGCVSPKHLSWKTKSENQLDRALHGTKSNGCTSRLTPFAVSEIRRLRGVMKQRELAEMFGTSRANVSLIQNGKHQNGRRMSPEQIAILSCLEPQPKRIKNIAATTGLTIETVGGVLSRLAAIGEVARPRRGHYCLPASSTL